MWTDLFKISVDVTGQTIFKCGWTDNLGGWTFLKSVDMTEQIFLEAFPVKIELDAVVKHALEDI